MSITTIKIGGIDIPYRFSTRARLLSIRVTGKGAELVIPKRISLNRATAFLEGKLGWLCDNLPTPIPKTQIIHGAVIPVLGNNLRVNHNSCTAGITHISGGFIEVYGQEASITANIRNILNKLLLDKTHTIAINKAAQLGVKVSLVKVKKLETMWGNCSKNGEVTVASTLVHAPLAVLEYVVAHEVAHLLEMNHSRKFWETVRMLIPEYHTHRKWLKENQTALGAWVS